MSDKELKIKHHGYYVALFDILGFESRLKIFGLKEMLVRYETLIKAVHYQETQMERVFGEFSLKEAPYWTAEGDVFIFTKTQGAYASDSILIWGNSTWPEMRELSSNATSKNDYSPKDEWKYKPIPCDNFLDVCNELMCRGMEVGLPLRGAIAVGDAILDPEGRIFLGQPIIDAARLERGQAMISTSFCKSVTNQIIPRRYSLQFDQHIKDNSLPQWSNSVLDWPRHWRKTRKADIASVIKALDSKTEFSHKYNKNTLDLIAHSEQHAGKFESLEESSIRAVYPEFAWSNTSLEIRAFPVRRVSILD
jgi:hypothetical protein